VTARSVGQFALVKHR